MKNNLLRLRRLAGLGHRQKDILTMLKEQNAAQRAGPVPPPWSKHGWVRIHRRWRILDGLLARGLIEFRLYTHKKSDWLTGPQARLTELGRLAAP